jgi:hypothetical protein
MSFDEAMRPNAARHASPKLVTGLTASSGVAAYTRLGLIPHFGGNFMEELMFQKRMIAAFVAVMVVLACTAMIASENSMGIAEKRNVTFNTPTLVGGTLLPAGNYNVTHHMDGTTHVMLFQQVGGKKAEAKATCTLVPLKAKAQRTEQIFNTNAKNQRVLTEMTFEGDTATHMIVQ